jgi:hypothetical protein
VNHSEVEILRLPYEATAGEPGGEPWDEE